MKNLKRENNLIKLYTSCVLLFSLLLVSKLSAQQYPQFTQYTYNMNIINPAYAGIKNSLSINIMGRTQWVGVEGAPRTGTLGIHTPLGVKRAFGLGFSAIYTELGPLKETHLYGDLAYKLEVSNDGFLSFGLKFGTSIQSLNQSLLRFNSNESLNTVFNNRTEFNLGFGLFFSQEKFFISASIPNILNTNFFEVDSSLDNPNRVSRNSTVFLGSGYVFEISNSLKMKPAMMLRYSSTVPVALDVSNTAFIDEIFELGISYRIKESVALIAALNLNKNLRIGYSYDFSTGNSFNSNGSHEMMFLYDIDLRDRIRRTPKYF
ncbi:PorP/SprF family type IX secretion system membrane protein [Tenacibaculum jejuense]|uniref:Type IX secretion system membrane protein, PorP/SprF family n=1 Tax=Tenacibaculum jejuense TaxID=584609 RepID=A0A238UCP7_9FLAO|nr:type IX secretion system membrane protein PorP/SprF [Tenacibaculum jejuense]SNR16244.1 Protein of unknown function precursor [Tenacibaculum jejuense]